VQGPAITQLGIDKIRFADPAYRRRFRKDYDKQWGARVWQRDFHDAEIVEAPDASLVGRTIGAVADERGEHPVDTFLDLVVEHGKALRWRTTIANHRPDRLQEIIAHPMVQPGFADSGAHLRNMAFYDFALHVLRMATLDDAPFDAAHAVHKVTGEIADWYGVDAGHLRVGAVADIAVIDPEALDERLDGYHEAEVDVFGGMSRMVRRNEAVRATLIGGRVVWRDGSFAEGFGEGWGTGRFLAPGEATEALALASK
jgi:N-acyl-D-aspartate/D-glutamate deacylase